MTLPRSYSQFAVYETFAPTALRNRSVVMMGKAEKSKTVSWACYFSTPRRISHFSPSTPQKTMVLRTIHSPN